MEVRFARAPADRLLVGCIVALMLVYVGWLLAMRLWLEPQQGQARQGFHGFVTGSSQPPAGGGEQSPAAAGEFGSSKLGISHYFGGATPRPIAEGARVVGSEAPVEPQKAEQPPAREQPIIMPVATSGSAEPSDGETGEPTIGRFRLGKVLRQWAHIPS
ncbi:MAG TPA: hypothetical protein VK034_31930 [Enhygromyxa sp.]|nr:hypothetical protein [Enhygromyxa sp.]